MLEPIPRPPDWHVDWAALDRAWPFLEAMKECPQASEYHGEGNVWIHTRMVCEQLASLPRWRELPENEREVVWAAALLHDVAKPACTRPGPDGRITSAGHARKGAVMARALLWRLGVSFERRELVCALIRHHMVPFWILDRDDSLRLLLEVSLTARCDLLSVLAEADARGRIAADQQELIDDTHLFAEFAREHGCLSRPYEFPSEHTRYAYFRSPQRSPGVEAYDDTRSRVTVLSGLPGAGKDTYASKLSLPQVSLDAIRAELRIRPTEDQAPVAERAREQARVFLRRGEPFVWNATNLSREQRERCLGLLADYRARIELVYCEAEHAELIRRNAEREPPFPGAVLERLLERWEVPDLSEAHRLELAF